MSDTDPFDPLQKKSAFGAEPTTDFSPIIEDAIVDPVPPRGLTEDWTAGIVGLVVVLSSLLLCLWTKPSDFQWSTRLVKAAISDSTQSSPAETNTVKVKPTWNASLLGWIGKVESWERSPLDGFTDKKKQKSIVPGILGALAATALVGLIAIALQRQPIVPFVAAFPVVFALALVANLMSKQSVIDSSNLEYVLWALLVGMVICNTIGTPKRWLPAVRGELYIKIGLVLLGAEVLFGRLLALGIPGVLVSWVVTPVVLVGTYIFGQRVLKMESKSLNLVISADMSVCGVSAAIATAAACKAKKEELSLAIGLSLAFTVIMMIVMPRVIIAMDLDPRVGGAWIGGTIDSTGAVAAAGESYKEALGGEAGQLASQTATTVKMIQNILIGIVSLAVAVYWAKSVDTSAGAPAVGASEIWNRFPKFVLGFISASILCSIIFAASLYGELWVSASTAGVTKPIREWMFCLAFVCLGLDTNFKELLPYFRSGKPLLLYVCGQALNILLTFLMAYLMFGVIFSE
jgi:uncharacterized integral membrane protein (TIGR00698 family)